jgi:hypothetical protein
LDGQIEKNEMGEQYGTYRGQEKCIQGLLRRPKGKKPLGRASLRWEDSIKMELKEVGWGGEVWTVLICVRIGTGGGLS